MVAQSGVPLDQEVLVKRRQFIGSATALAFVPLLAPARAQQAVVSSDGSSTVFPVAEAVAEEFQRRTRTRVTVGISGTGGGFRKFCRGESDVSNASRPILREEMEACRQNNVQYIELPVAFDALTVAVNPRNDFVRAMTVAELRRIWEPGAQGRITRWNQIRPEWPDRPFRLFGAGADSGTFDYFTEAVNGRAKASRADYTASEDDNVLVQGIENDRDALGYIPYAYFLPHANRMRAIGIDDGRGRGPVLPSEQTVIDGTYNPLSRPLFIYVSLNAANTKPHVQQYIDFFLTQAAPLIREVKYVPLPEQAYTMGQQRFRARQVGTAFGGVPEVGLPILEILNRAPRS
jgi:phosphate transport system substrate-binding protein